MLRKIKQRLMPTRVSTGAFAAGWSGSRPYTPFATMTRHRRDNLRYLQLNQGQRGIERDDRDRPCGCRVLKEIECDQSRRPVLGLVLGFRSALHFRLPKSMDQMRMRTGWQPGSRSRALRS